MNTKWKVLYFISGSYSSPVKEFIDKLEVREQVKVLRILQYIQEYGLSSALSHVKKFSHVPLWEIRILGRDSIRVLYVVPYVQTVLLLHGFRKKTQKTPEKEVQIALYRYSEWLTRQKR